METTGRACPSPRPLPKYPQKPGRGLGSLLSPKSQSFRATNLLTCRKGDQRARSGPWEEPLYPPGPAHPPWS